jgi:DNA topoisomerase-2
LAIFVNCLVENPTFDSQTKEHMTIKPSTFSNTKYFGSYFSRNFA